MKALLEEESDKMPIEEEIEKQVNFFSLYTKLCHLIIESGFLIEYVTWFSVPK